MTYQKCSRNSAFLIVDAIVSLALSAALLSVMTYATLNAQATYGRAETKKSLIERLQAHASEFDGLIPGESRYRIYDSASSSPISIRGSARWYGNDRVETILVASSSQREIEFRKVRMYPYGTDADAAGTPLCSVDFGTNISVRPIMLPIKATLPLTDLQVRNGRAYITADSSVQSDPDFFVVDIHESVPPAVLSSLNTGPGLRSISLAGVHAYAAAVSTAAQLHVIRVQSSGQAALVTKYQLPLPEASTSPPIGSAIFYDKGRVYLGTEKWDGEEFSIIDVSVPASPSKVGGLETGSKINSIYVRRGTAHVAASDQNQLRYVDVTGPSPVFLNAFTPSGWQRQEGEFVAAFEDAHAFGRSSGGFNITSDHEVFLWSTSSGPPLSADFAGGVYGIILDRAHAYTITHAVNKELMITDRSLATSTARYVALPVMPQAITCDLGKIYILAKTAPAIYEISFDH